MREIRRVYAECNITINPTVTATPTRKRFAKTDIKILTSQSVNTPMKPITLVVKGENFARVMELVKLYSMDDEALISLARSKLELKPEVESLSDEELVVWVRDGVTEELRAMTEEAE